MRARASIGLAVILWLAVPACIITTTQQKPPPDPKTPARLEGKSPPPLEDTAVPGVKHAVIDVPDVYYHEAKERWFRWALGHWFVAFLWNGQWFPVDKGELPVEMAKLEPTVEEKHERKLTRAEELKKLDEEMRRIETEPQAPVEDEAKGAIKTTDEVEGESKAKAKVEGEAKSDTKAKTKADELRELDEQLEQLEKQDQEEKKK